MRLKALIRFQDGEKGPVRKKGEVFEADEARGKTLLTKKLSGRVPIVERADIEKKEEVKNGK